MGWIGVDRSKELKITEEENDLENRKWKETETKVKTIEQGKPMNSQVIREISPITASDVQCIFSGNFYLP